MEEKKCCFRCEGLLFVKTCSGGKRALRRNGAVSFFCLLFLIPPQPLTHPPPSSLPSPPSSSHSVNSVSAQTDKTVRFTRPHVRGSTRKSPLKTTHASPPLRPHPHPPTHTRTHTHLHLNITLFMAWSSSSTYITGHYFHHYTALHHHHGEGRLFPHGEIKYTENSYLHVPVYISSHAGPDCYSRAISGALGAPNNRLRVWLWEAASRRAFCTSKICDGRFNAAVGAANWVWEPFVVAIFLF